MLINFLKQSWLVIAAALVFGLMVSGIFGQLDPIIKENEWKKLKQSMENLLSAATVFIPKDENGDTIQEEEEKTVSYYVGYESQEPNGVTSGLVGYAITAIGSGFADKIQLLVGFDGQVGKVLGIAILKTNETPGFGDKIKDAEFKDQFRDCPAVKLSVVKTGDRSVADEQIVAITGATISSEAVATIVNGALNNMRDLLGIEPEEQPEPATGMRGIRRGRGTIR